MSRSATRQKPEVRRLLGVLESKLDLQHLRIRATSIDSYWDDLSNHQKTSVRQSNLRATRTSLLLFCGNPCAILFLWGGWAAVRQAALMQAFTKPPSLRLRIRSGHAFTTPKTPPRCFGLASDGLPRRPQIHQAYKSCIAFVFVWLIDDLVVRHTHTRIARIMQKP